MQGYWKNNISGWNHKDSRRKKQTRQNYIRDRGVALHKLFANSYRKKEPLQNEAIYRIENEVELKMTRGDVFPHLLESKNTVEIWKVLYNENIYIVWERGGQWYDDVTNEDMGFYIEWDSHNFRKLELLSVEGYDNSADLEKAKEPYNRYSIMDFTKKEFFLGKPLCKKDINWDDGKRRQFCQDIATSRDRTNLRIWIRKGDWESEMKTHCDSKSINWSVS